MNDQVKPFQKITFLKIYLFSSSGASITDIIDTIVILPLITEITPKFTSKNPGTLIYLPIYLPILSLSRFSPIKKIFYFIGTLNLNSELLAPELFSNLLVFGFKFPFFVIILYQINENIQ